MRQYEIFHKITRLLPSTTDPRVLGFLLSLGTLLLSISPVSGLSSVDNQSMNDKVVLDLAYKAVGGDKQSLTILQNQAVAKIAAAEYGLGVYYYTTALVISSATPCLTDWVDTPDMEAAERLMKKTTNNQVHTLCIKALENYTKASNNGDKAAVGDLARISFSNAFQWTDEMKSFDKSADVKTSNGVKDALCHSAIHWVYTASNQHNATGAFYRGFMHATQTCVSRNRTETMRWFDIACHEGSAPGCTTSANLYEQSGNDAVAERYINVLLAKTPMDLDTAAQLALFYRFSHDTVNSVYWSQKVNALRAAQYKEYPILKTLNDKAMQSQKGVD